MKMSTAFHKQVREEMSRKRSTKHWSKKDVEAILEAKQTGDWSEVESSKFYVQYGGEFCSMLEVLNKLGK
jgi:hypothetical protein